MPYHLYTTTMKLKTLFSLLLAALLMSSCGTSRTVPVTGRKQNLMISDEQVLSLSTQEYSKYMKGAKVSTNKAKTEMVKRVGQRLATAVETYLRQNGLAQELQYYKWEFNLVQDNAVNAFCMPGGKIVVYEGLLPVTKDEASLAIVLGHEIAHAVAKHSAEQMSEQLRAQYAAQGLSIAGSILGMGSNTQSIAQAALSLGYSFAAPKFSRKHETEADTMGLIFAAMAGYNPEVAVAFWQRMAAQSGNANQTSIFSTHPSDAQRIANIKQQLPTALKYYKKQ